MGSYTKHRAITDDLRGIINRGELAPHELLPSEAVLGDRYEVSRSTIRAALAALTNEGLITSEPGRGWVVRQSRHLVYRPQDDAGLPGPTGGRFETAAEAEGRDWFQTVGVALVTAPPEVAERLQVPADAVTVVRTRVQGVDGLPMKIYDSYFPRDVVEHSDIMLPGIIPGGANRILTELGYEQIRTHDEILIRMPTPKETEVLQLGPGTPVAVHILTSFTAKDRPVRVAITILPGDRWIIVWDQERAPTGGAA